MNNGTRKEEPRPLVAPVVDVREDGDGYILSAALPGVDEGAVNLTVEDRTMILDAANDLPEPEGFKVLQREIPPVTYHAVFELPERVDRSAIRSTLRNGLLTVTLPKREEVKPRRIAVAVE